MAMKPLTKIKHGELVLKALAEAHFFADIARATSLNTKTLQLTLSRLAKNGYIVKDDRNNWIITGDNNDEATTAGSTN